MCCKKTLAFPYHILLVHIVLKDNTDLVDQLLLGDHLTHPGLGTWEVPILSSLSLDHSEVLVCMPLSKQHALWTWEFCLLDLIFLSVKNCEPLLGLSCSLRSL